MIVLVTVFVVSAIGTYAQCDKKNVVTASQTDYLDSTNNLQRSVPENSIVEFDNKEIIITPGDNPSMRGTITSINCNWTTPYKNGKTVIKASFENPERGTMHLTINIAGKDGKIEFLAIIEEQPDRRIRITVDNFEEKK